MRTFLKITFNWKLELEMKYLIPSPSNLLYLRNGLEPAVQSWGVNFFPVMFPHCLTIAFPCGFAEEPWAPGGNKTSTNTLQSRILSLSFTQYHQEQGQLFQESRLVFYSFKATLSMMMSLFVSQVHFIFSALFISKAL